TTAEPAVFCSVFRVCDAQDRALLESSRRFAAVTVSGVRDRVNNVLDPSGGSLVTVTLMHASRIVYSDTLYEFNRGELEASRYYPLGRRAVFAWGCGRARSSWGGSRSPARASTSCRRTSASTAGDRTRCAA